jgi:ferrous iron transport protein A
MSIIPLSLMQMGSEGEVVDVKGGWGMVRKLEAMGIRKGVRIRKLSTQPMRGPVFVQAGNTRVAIGFGMAQRILVAIK